MTTHRCIEFEGQLSLFYFAVIKCFTHVIFFHVLHTLCVYFTKKGPVRLKFPNLKSVTISFAFKQSRKVFLFSRCLGQINCWTRMLWNKLPAKQNGMINLQIYESSVKAFTCLANWLSYIFNMPCKTKHVYKALAKIETLKTFVFFCPIRRQNGGYRLELVWPDIVPRGSSPRSLLFFVPYFCARLYFPSPPLSAPGSPRMPFSMLEVLVKIV